MFANTVLMFGNVIVNFELISARVLVICELIFERVAMKFELVICEIIFELVANKSVLFLQFWGVRRHAQWRGKPGRLRRQRAGALCSSVAAPRPVARLRAAPRSLARQAWESSTRHKCTFVCSSARVCSRVRRHGGWRGRARRRGRWRDKESCSAWRGSEPYCNLSVTRAFDLDGFGWEN
jgi:hypothetical protein